MNGLRVTRYVGKSPKSVTIFIPLPREAWREIPGGCACDYCKVDGKSGPAYWDTLAVAADGRENHTWTVHYPELQVYEKKESACVECEQPFTTDNPCCCDYALNEDGTHVDGVCVRCCQPHHAHMPKSNA